MELCMRTKHDTAIHNKKNSFYKHNLEGNKPVMNDIYLAFLLHIKFKSYQNNKIVLKIKKK